MRAWKTEDGGRNTRSVLECGGPPPLLNRSKDSAFQSARGLAQSKTCRIALAFCLLTSAFCLRAWGQSYSIDWYKIAGGGGTSTGATYQVAGTIGQPDASGVISGGNYSLTGGFWSLIVVVQTPGAPLLTITLNPQHSTINVSWPSPSTGWTLQQNSDLTTTSWSTSGGISDNGTIKSITITSPPGNLFFRLRNP
jgi:hypothetical protein